MTNQCRVELLQAVAELGRRYPDWRLGQLLANIAGWADVDVWDVEDEPLLQAIRLHLEQVDQRETKATA
jgi:hypothetical protein